MNLTKFLYTAARASATGRAVRNGRIGKRAYNIAVGRLIIGPIARRLYK